MIHLDAAYNLARWLINDEATAEDAVQEACIRAQRFFHSQSGPNPKAWFMAVVRNACMDELRDRKQQRIDDSYDEQAHGHLHNHVLGSSDEQHSPERLAMQQSDARWVQAAIAKLPIEYREVIILRELEDMSYKEISAIVNVPMGTVMSRLARGRDQLAVLLDTDQRKAQP